MGGSGGGSHGYSRELPSSGKKISDDDCNKVNFLTQLQMIQPAVTNYAVDDVLSVEDYFGTVIVTGKHGTCGSITSMEVIKLIECMKKGFFFKAIIVNITSSTCEVKVLSLIK